MKLLLWVLFTLLPLSFADTSGETQSQGTPLRVPGLNGEQSAENNYENEIRCGSHLGRDAASLGILSLRNHMSHDYSFGGTESRVMGFPTRRAGSSSTHGVYIIEPNGATYYEVTHSFPKRLVYSHGPQVNLIGHRLLNQELIEERGGTELVFFEPDLHPETTDRGILRHPHGRFHYRESQGQLVNDHTTQKHIENFLKNLIESIPNVRGKASTVKPSENDYIEGVRNIVCTCDSIQALKQPLQDLVAHEIFNQVRGRLDCVPSVAYFEY
ncbi:MAG: hypothetical protein AAF202_03945 [Pseudomonadota bacterium]